MKPKSKAKVHLDDEDDDIYMVWVEEENMWGRI